MVSIHIFFFTFVSVADIHPKLDCQDQLAERLQNTNNVTELLVFLRKQLKPLMME